MLLVDYILIVSVCIGFSLFWENKLRKTMFGLETKYHAVELSQRGWPRLFTQLLTCVFCYSSWLAFIVALFISSNIFFALPCLISVGGWVAWIQNKLR